MNGFEGFSSFDKQGLLCYMTVFTIIWIWSCLGLK